MGTISGMAGEYYRLFLRDGLNKPFKRMLGDQGVAKNALLVKGAQLMLELHGYVNPEVPYVNEKGKRFTEEERHAWLEDWRERNLMDEASVERAAELPLDFNARYRMKGEE